MITVLLSGCSGRRSRPNRSRSKGSVTETTKSRRKPSSRVSNSNRTNTRQSQNSKNIKVSNNNTLTGAQVFERYNSAVFTIYIANFGEIIQGSGFFISQTGIGVSNYHVFADSYIEDAILKLSDEGTYYVDKILAMSEDDDYIVFKVKSTNKSFNYIPISSRKPKVGEKIFTIGSPLGLENTFSSGEISQLRDEWIQISAPIDHGSSGGALINEYGEAIGITTARIDASSANLNFAISIDKIKPYI